VGNGQASPPPQPVSRRNQYDQSDILSRINHNDPSNIIATTVERQQINQDEPLRPYQSIPLGPFSTGRSIHSGSATLWQSGNLNQRTSRPNQQSTSSNQQAISSSSRPINQEARPDPRQIWETETESETDWEQEDDDMLAEQELRRHALSRMRTYVTAGRGQAQQSQSQGAPQRRRTTLDTHVEVQDSEEEVYEQYYMLRRGVSVAVAQRNWASEEYAVRK
jgi:hypothetical protein